jgi:hypothetical protein
MASHCGSQEHSPRKTVESLSIESLASGAYEHDILLDGDQAVQRDPRALANMRRTRFRTMVVINAASVLEKTDEQLLPSVYKYVSCSFDASPGALPIK